MTLEQAVWVDPGRMSGEPCFRGTRLPVQQLFDWLADGVPLDEFLRDFALDPRAADTVLRVGAAGVCEEPGLRLPHLTPTFVKVLLDVGISPRLRLPLQQALDDAPVESAVFNQWRTLRDDQLLALASLQPAGLSLATAKLILHPPCRATQLSVLDNPFEFTK